MTIKFVSVPSKRLAETINSTSYTFVLDNILGWDGTALEAADFGSDLYVSFRNSAGTKLELMKVDPSTIASSSITILKRGLGFSGDQVTEVTANIQDVWTKGDTIVELGSHVPQLLEETVRKSGDETVAGKKTFSSVPATTGGNAVNSNDLVNLAQAISMLTGTTNVDRIVVSATAGETLAAGNLVYLKESDGRWWKADADLAASSENVMLGVAQGAGTAGGAVTSGVLVWGVDSNQTGLTTNSVYYVSNTAGSISLTPGTVEVSVGYSRSTTSFFLNPRYNQQITEDQQDALVGTSGSPSASNRYVTNDDTSATATASKVVRADASGKIAPGYIQVFGGDGSDGALTVSSGTTNIDLGGAAVVVKQYTSISITGTGAVTFSNPHTNGTLIIIKSQGDVTLTSSTIPNLDASGMGGAAGTGGATSANASNQVNNPGTDATTIVANFQGDTSTSYGKGGAASAITGGAGGTIFGNLFMYTLNDTTLTNRRVTIAPGFGGGGGAGGQSQLNSTSAGGAGGRGGGGLVIQCGGALNFTSALGIDVSGKNGTAAANVSTSGQTGAGGGGGGGGSGMCLILYNTLTAASGTVNAKGGSGGKGGDVTTTTANGSASGTGGGGGGGGTYASAGGAGGNGSSGAGNGSAGGSAAGSGGGGGGGAAGSGAGSWTGGAGGTSTTSTSLWFITKNKHLA